MSLQGLPLEICLKIIDSLDNASKVALSLTCSRLHRLINSKTITWTMPDLLLIERWPVYDRVGHTEPEAHMKQVVAGCDFFACHCCLRIRDAVHFTNAMMKGARGKHGSRQEAWKRACIDCMVQLRGVTKAGETIRYGGYEFYDPQGRGGGIGILCIICRQFKRVSHDYRDRDPCDDCAKAL